MFTTDQVQKLHDTYSTVSGTYIRLMYAYSSVEINHERSREYITHGFLRRLSTLRRCIQNVYSIYLPERTDVPSREECIDLAINLQSFVFNVFGCIDNLAWIWTTEKQLPLKRSHISFSKEKLRNTLPAEFQVYLTSLKGWFDYMEDFRHALAHRIPLYIPPYVVSMSNIALHNQLEEQKRSTLREENFEAWERLNRKQEKLGHFLPAMTHSHQEAPGALMFHAQVLADWNTVAEIAEKFLALLNSSSASPNPD